MITPDGRVLLTDFGIAKGLSRADDDLTSDNVMMGTAKYLSPEQVRGKKLDGRADLYSLGLVLYECLAGRVPFLGETDADTALARLQRDPTDLARLRPTLPNGLVDLIHRLLARNPAHRPRPAPSCAPPCSRVATSPPAIDGTTGRAARPARQPATRGARRRPRPTRANRGRSRRVAAPASAGEPNVTTGTVPLVRRAASPARRPYRRRRPAPPADRPDPRPHRRATTSSAVAPSLIARRRALLVVAPIVVASCCTSASTAATTGRRRRRRRRRARQHGCGRRRRHRSPPTAGRCRHRAGRRRTGHDRCRRRADHDDPGLDPDGDNGTENDAQAGLALRRRQRQHVVGDRVLRDRSTWAAKRGVGLIVSLSGPPTGTLRRRRRSTRPYQLDVLHERRRRRADRPRRLGSTVGDDAVRRANPARSTSRVDTPATFVLVLLNELGHDDACTDEPVPRSTRRDRARRLTSRFRP